MDLPEQSPEERAKRIADSKIKEAEEDKWAKDNGHILERDSCEKCLKYREDDTQRNYLGSRLYCCAGHAYEVGNIKKGIYFKELRKEIFNTIYQWGRVGVVVDENAPAIKEKLDTLENRWY